MSKYEADYCCISNIGKHRKINQDNFIVEGRYLKNHEPYMTEPLTGSYKGGKPMIVGVFDGMGGEECGEVASFLASEAASQTGDFDDPLDAVLNICERANDSICRYARENSVETMGTTGAMLAFSEDGVTLCNIGDSRIFHYASGELKQISVDHTAPYIYGGKPPLSQNLGIPPEEMMIEPYVARGRYQDGDRYLISSDGLTDMVSEDRIAQIISENDIKSATEKLLQAALDNGGKDNITIILCKITKKGFFARLLGR